MLTEAELNKQVNELGYKIAGLLEARSSVVVVNVALRLFAGAAKADGLPLSEAQRLLEEAWDASGGFSAEVSRLN